MVATCIQAFKARKLRLIKLDACGVPVTGTESAVAVFDGFISVKPSPQYDEGAEFIQKTADGALCINEKDPNSLKRVDLEIQVCTLDPDVIVIASGERLLTTGSATGTGVAFGEGQLLGRYSLELWQPVTGDGACDPSGQQQYVWWAFPNIGNTMLSDFTFENAAFNFTWKSSTKGVSPLWISRLGSLATGLGSNTLQPGEHFAFNVTTTAPPASTCGAVLLT